jgi:hypothetical protein
LLDIYLQLWMDIRCELFENTRVGFRVPGALLREVTMTNPLRFAVLALLTAFLIPSAPTGSAAATAAKKHHLFCENSKDCPESDFCRVKPGHKTGICVATKKKK